MDKTKLVSTAKKLVAPGKGILAADESTPTIKKRLDLIGVESTEKTRKAYRQLLFTAPGIEEAISGVILFDETLRLSSLAQGKPAAKILKEKGIIPGIKVDKGAKDLANFPGEKITEGLGGLRERLKEYADLGTGFTKWRAVITIGKGIPTKACIDANAHALARYAALSQEAGLVPIVEPEVLMTGEHTIEKHSEVTEITLNSVFSELEKYKVYLPGILLKPNMITSGLEADSQVGADEVAKETVKVLKQVVPENVPGIVFLSGGLRPDSATSYLNSMNILGEHPWELSYSFGRALQGEALRAWAGKEENVDKAQKAFRARADKTSKARYGTLES
ncbi:fructose-bisphosphate aldolase class I [Patescibacteria group bacterium]|nr:fructose-bisphosphate aldolase class I [Patescibacteria group bacterium]